MSDDKKEESQKVEPTILDKTISHTIEVLRSQRDAHADSVVQIAVRARQLEEVIRQQEEILNNQKKEIAALNEAVNILKEKLYLEQEAHMLTRRKNTRCERSTSHIFPGSE